jgi:hypothetical protein
VRKNKLKIALVIAVIAGVALLVLLAFDLSTHRKVHLRYVGKATVAPDVKMLLERKQAGLSEGWDGVWTIERGKSELIHTGLEGWLENYKDDVDVQINWDGLELSEDKIYYACVSCEIEEVRYTTIRWCRQYKDPLMFHIESVSLTPKINENTITVYEGDVIVVEFDC